MRTPPLLADFSHARPCKPFCENSLTLLSSPSTHFSWLAGHQCVRCFPHQTDGHCAGDYRCHACRSVRCAVSVSIFIPPFSVDFSRRGAAAKPPNLRISASGNTQYELTQSINSPWARRFTLDPMGRLPSTCQWALPLDPNRALHPCTQHKGLAALCTPARRSRLPPLVRFLSAPPALNDPFVTFPGMGDTGVSRYQFTAKIPGVDPSFSCELTRFQALSLSVRKT